MKQFYVLVRVFFLFFILGFFSCEKNEEFISTETAVVNDISESGLKVPDLQDVKINFKSKTSINKLFQSSNSSKSSTGSDLNFSIDWESSFPTEFNPEMNLDVLYTPVHFNSTKRIKSFIASATINDTLVSQIVTLAYVGKPSLEYFHGYIFFHDLTGAFKSSSYYEFGEKIKTSYALNTKRNSTNKGSCAEAQFEYILEYGLDGYEDFFGSGLCSEVTVVAEISSSDGGGGGSYGGNTDFPSSGGMYIPTYSGGGGGSGGGTSTPSPTSTPSVDDGSNEPVTTLEPDPYWQEIIAPNESMIATLATELDLNSTQAEWLENTQNNVNLRLLPFQIINFLDQNLWSIEAKNFAQEAIGVLMDDGEVDFVNEIIKDKSFVGTKADCILNALITQGNNIFRKTSEAFTNNRSKFKLKFTLINEPSNIADAQTPFPDSNSNGIITIEVNEPVISGSNYLDYAKAILHETIHAELHRLKIAGNLGPNPIPSEQYNLYMHMWDFYEEVNSSPNYIATQSQHYLMAQYYIDNIAKGLWEFNQFQANMSDYKHLAWEGLNSYGIQGKFITQNELDNLSNMYSNVPKNSDPCN